MTTCGGRSFLTTTKTHRLSISSARTLLHLIFLLLLLSSWLFIWLLQFGRETFFNDVYTVMLPGCHHVTVRTKEAPITSWKPTERSFVYCTRVWGGGWLGGAQKKKSRSCVCWLLHTAEHKEAIKNPSSRSGRTLKEIVKHERNKCS